MRQKGNVVFTAILVLSAVLAACEGGRGGLQPQHALDMELIEAVTTDKARYRPGEAVRYELNLKPGDEAGTLIIRYKHLNDVVEEREIEWSGESRLTWEWLPPEDDFKGYMTEIFLKNESGIADHENIAVDVSSDWGRFPRYGYLADFGEMTDEERSAVINRLNRFHINGVQFYDWQWKHHMPIPVNNGEPAESWPDIANRLVSYETVKHYIDLAHERNMSAMNYNLLFGAYEDAEEDGVRKEWGVFRDPLHENQDQHPLPDSWASDILLQDPSNPGWRAYLLEQMKLAFAHLPFDGWHVDQLGQRGSLWNYDGKKVDLAQSYGPFLEEAKNALGVELVMNAVGQYGQAWIAQSPVTFLYTEVWDGHPSYRDLKAIVDQNVKFSKGKLNTVFAAYVNYEYSNWTGEFNAPGVLLANAVIFAAGGAHLELGENMLSKEYFPHKNLKVSAALEQQLVRYYDFLTAYQNLLRDGVEESELEVSAVSGAELSVQAVRGKVWSFAKRKPGVEVVHLVNFTDAAHMNWNDTYASQPEPEERKDIKLSITTDQKVERIWWASPDAYHGSPSELAFSQRNGRLEVTLPTLKYWDMLVVEYVSRD